MAISFGLGKDVSVLEAKFQIYEDLSKEMLDKLERAVNKISESNISVALILERHENRLEQVDKADALILSLINDVKHNLEGVEKRVDDLAKFRWITVGIATAAAFVMGSSGLFTNGMLTIGPQRATMEEQNIHRSK